MHLDRARLTGPGRFADHDRFVCLSGRALRGSAAPSKSIANIDRSFLRLNRSLAGTLQAMHD